MDENQQTTPRKENYRGKLYVINRAASSELAERGWNPKEIRENKSKRAQG